MAYQVIGDGPIDLVFHPFPGRWNLDILWEYPPLVAFLERLASFSRLIVFNARGTAISDPLPHGPVHTPEDYARDIIQVMDDLGARQASIFAIEGATMVGVYTAATQPERIRSLALLNGWGTFLRTDDYPLGMPPEVSDRFFAAMSSEWGTGKGLEFMAPDYAKDEHLRTWWARMERNSMSAAAISMQPRTLAQWDVRGALGSIRAPTLVIEHEHVPWLRRGVGSYLADRIRGAEYHERPGTWGGVYWEEDADHVLDLVQRFLTGSAPEAVEEERVLATVMFTDIVESTEHAASLGDRRWRAVLDQHDQIAQEHIDRFRGRHVKSTGDGVLATFDGPARAIRCARSLIDSMRSIGLEIRTGLHTGEIELRGDDIAGIGVVIGARVMANADAGEILVSGAVPPLVAGSGLAFDDRGTHELKGVPGVWALFAVDA